MVLTIQIQRFSIKISGWFRFFGATNKSEYIWKEDCICVWTTNLSSTLYAY